MDMDEELFSYEEKMEKSCDALNEEYQGIRAGRANPAILNRLRVDYYGVSSTIQQVANEERRKDLAKDVKKKAENAKVAIRNIRRDANEAFKKMQKNSEITEDELKDSEEEVQKLTDKYIDKIDKMAEAKTKEIMTV